MTTVRELLSETSDPMARLMIVGAVFVYRYLENIRAQQAYEARLNYAFELMNES